MTTGPGANLAEPVTVTPPAGIRRRHDIRFAGLFVLFALPVGAVLFAIIGPWIALAYVVGQTAFLTYGLRRRHVPKLRLGEEGLSYEPGRFQLRCTWADIDGVQDVTLPSGTVESFTIGRSALHWAGDARVRDEVRAKGWDKVIPVAEFEPDWRAGAIGQAARRWAPRLLDQAG